MPKNHGNQNTWGMYENFQVYKDYAEGSRWTIPTDWFFMILYEVDYDKWYVTKDMRFKSWVAEYSAADARQIRDAWQPTGTEYISRAEKERRRKEREAELQRVLEEERLKREKELEEQRKKAEAEAKRKAEELEILKKK